MFNLHELSYTIQKDMYFTGRICNEAYNIYYSDNIPSQHCNFAVLSDVVPLDFVYEDICRHFAKLKCPVTFYIDSNMHADMQCLIDKKFRITYSGKWLCYDSQRIIYTEKLPAEVKKVTSGQTLNDFLEIFEENYSKKLSHYAIEDVKVYIEAIRKNFENPKYQNFISYDGRRPVAIATIGETKGFNVVFNQGAADGFLDSPSCRALMHACMNFYIETKGRSLCTRIISNPVLEKQYEKFGFKKNKVIYRMTLENNPVL